MSEHKKYAGFWIRVCADFIDSILLDAGTCVIGFMALGCIYWIKTLILRSANGTHFSIMNAFDSLGLQIFLLMTRAGLSLFYYTWGGYRYGTSIGKRAFNIYIVSGDDEVSPISFYQSLTRCLSYLLSYLLFSAGFLMVAFNPKKKGLHDLIADTVCIRKRRKSRNKEGDVLAKPSVDDGANEAQIPII
jgi:uncharacterized RDD family membrane protein YckC